MVGALYWRFAAELLAEYLSAERRLAPAVEAVAHIEYKAGYCDVAGVEGRRDDQAGL